MSRMTSWRLLTAAFCLIAACAEPGPVEPIAVEHHVFRGLFIGLDHQDLVTGIERARARDPDSDREVGVLVRLQELADRVTRAGREFDW